MTEENMNNFYLCLSRDGQPLAVFKGRIGTSQLELFVGTGNPERFGVSMENGLVKLRPIGGYSLSVIQESLAEAYRERGITVSGGGA